MEKRIGRPPGQKYGDLIHIRISEDLRVLVDEVRESLPSKPSLAVFVRQALENEVKRARGK